MRTPAEIMAMLREIVAEAVPVPPSRRDIEARQQERRYRRLEPRFRVSRARKLLAEHGLSLPPEVTSITAWHSAVNTFVFNIKHRPIRKDPRFGPDMELEIGIDAQAGDANAFLLVYPADDDEGRPKEWNVDDAMRFVRDAMGVMLPEDGLEHTNHGATDRGGLLGGLLAVQYGTAVEYSISPRALGMLGREWIDLLGWLDQPGNSELFARAVDGSGEQQD